MPLTHINSTPSGQFPAKKAGNIHKIPASWRVAKNLAPSINTIKSTSTCLLSLDMGEPILAKPQSLNALRDTIKERLHNHHDESAAQGIAVYGFAAQQLNNCHYLYSTKPRKAITTISNFNTKLDLVKEPFNYQLSIGIIFINFYSDKSIISLMHYMKINPSIIYTLAIKT
ncbi:hypothetical protein NVI2019_PEGOAJLN_01387 [Providencia alcalifaciens]|uniref:hypothetical protein n=1 Tax=Providencia alcalifaciens TaxID=126385 RepID=UPI00044EDD5C|nr:hypothetical protein [Providencia alcalifaciens]EUD03770.1 hypothetical protein HMPREF1565_1284 [Providencia alcalifaciens RIMD 1656011]CAG9416681.1 hypothetical protein NVI2019_PEGOAJLN_01387 [Providencia alcalifaciens]